MELNEAIQQILKEIRKDEYFDSHAIIKELMINKEYHQIYLEEYSKGLTVAQYHGKIAQMIGKTGVVKKIQDDTKDILIKTHTIYGDLSENHLWKKIK